MAVADAATEIADLHTVHTTRCLIDRFTSAAPCSCSRDLVADALARDIRAAITAAEQRGRVAGVREAAERCSKKSRVMGVAGYPDADVACARVAADLHKLIEDASRD